MFRAQIFSSQALDLLVRLWCSGARAGLHPSVRRFVLLLLGHRETDPETRPFRKSRQLDHELPQIRPGEVVPDHHRGTIEPFDSRKPALNSQDRMMISNRRIEASDRPVRLKHLVVPRPDLANQVSLDRYDPSSPHLQTHRRAGVGQLHPGLVDQARDRRRPFHDRNVTERMEAERDRRDLQLGLQLAG